MVDAEEVLRHGALRALANVEVGARRLEDEADLLLQGLIRRRR
jgi:hypothetical protein